MKYFIYTRKSTDSEERQILSIEAQLAELKEFAAKEKLEIVLFASASRLRTASVGQARRGGRKGGSGGILSAEPIVRKISSDFFKYTPPVGKRKVWLALCEGSPADFRRKIEFFVFVPRSKSARSGLSLIFCLIVFILFDSIALEVIISFTTILPKLYNYDKWKNNQR